MLLCTSSTPGTRVCRVRVKQTPTMPQVGPVPAVEATVPEQQRCSGEVDFATTIRTAAVGHKSFPDRGKFRSAAEVISHYG